MEVPERAGSFGRDAAGQHLMDGAKNGVGHEMAKNMSNGNRGRALSIQDAVRRRGNLELFQRHMVVGDFRRQRALDCVGIGCGVDQRAVDTLGARR